MKPETKPPQPVLCGCGQSQYNVRCPRCGVTVCQAPGHRKHQCEETRR